MVDTINPCVALCGFTVMIECDQREGGSDLRQDCEDACADGDHDSIRSGAIIGQRLVNKNGCEKYFRPTPVAANDTERSMTGNEILAVAAIVVGGLILLSMMPVPIFI